MRQYPRTGSPWPAMPVNMSAVKALVIEPIAKSRHVRCIFKFEHSGPGCAKIRAARRLSACLPWPPHASELPRPMPATSQSTANHGGRTVCRFSNFLSEYLSVTKLYVGNLPFTATEESVRALFSERGTVEKVARSR